MLPIEPGAVVRLTGLQAKGAQFNGSPAIVVSLHETPCSPQQDQQDRLQDVRWVVRVMGTETEKTLAVRCENVRTARSGPSWLRLALGIAAAMSLVAAAVALAAGPGTLACGLAPICSLILYIGTQAVCYWLHAPLLADGVLFPQISDLSMSPPARLVYRTGFGLCGLLLAVTVLLLRSLAVAQNIKGTSDGVGSSPEPGIMWGLAAAGGVALQGICVLGFDLGAQTMAHFGGAILAMMGAMNHGAMSNAWFSALPSDSALLQAGFRSWGLWIRRDAAQQLPPGGLLFVLFLVPLAMQAIGRMGGASSGGAVMNGMGLMQWAIVACIAGYFSSYTFDLMVS